MNYLAQIIYIIPTWKQAKSKSEADTKTIFSVQVLWAIANMSCKCGCNTTNIGDTALI